MLLRLIANLLKRPRRPGDRGAPSVTLSRELSELRLRSCTAVADCQAACCSKGVRVDIPEAERLAAFVREHPELFRHLADPERAFVPLDSLGSPQLWQTEIVTPRGLGRDGLYRAATSGQVVTPADQVGSMCVFALRDGRCSFQLASVALGFHKWEYKPTPCWLFPLKLAKRETSGQASYELDWIGSTQDKLAHYPCSRRDPEGLPATQALREEIGYFAAQHARSGSPARRGPAPEGENDAY